MAKYRRVNRCSGYVFIILIAALTCGPAFGQTATTGTVLGTASDTTGAVIPGVAIELKDNATGAVRTTINVTPQQWFENSLSPGATARLAASNSTDFTIGRVQNLWANGIDPMLISLGRPPINNRQVGRTLSTTYGGWNNYNAGFISLNKRIGAMSFNFNYTFSKNLETLGGITDGSSSSCMNNWDFSYCYGPALSDRTHGVNFYGVFELPFGAGRYFNTPGALDKIAGG